MNIHKVSLTLGDILPLKTVIEPCKGWIYRGKVNTYYNKGVFRTDKRLTLLKRKSCEGCPECDYLHAELENSSIEEFPIDDIEHGKLYELKINYHQNDYFDHYDYDVSIDFKELEEYEQ